LTTRKKRRLKKLNSQIQWPNEEMGERTEQSLFKDEVEMAKKQ
jgi:hypothetical protein